MKKSAVIVMKTSNSRHRMFYHRTVSYKQHNLLGVIRVSRSFEIRAIDCSSVWFIATTYSANRDAIAFGIRNLRDRFPYE